VNGPDESRTGKAEMIDSYRKAPEAIAGLEKRQYAVTQEGATEPALHTTSETRRRRAPALTSSPVNQCSPLHDNTLLLVTLREVTISTASSFARWTSSVLILTNLQQKDLMGLVVEMVLFYQNVFVPCGY
jgi:hypothetical protein